MTHRAPTRRDRRRARHGRSARPVYEWQPDEYDEVEEFEEFEPDTWSDRQVWIDRPERRHGRVLPTALAAGIGLLGVALLITGSTQVLRLDEVAGLPAPTHQFLIANHQGGGPINRTGHNPGSPAGASAGTPSSTAAAPPSSADAAQRPAQGTQLPNTIRLPRGGTAYLVHSQVGTDGALPIPAGVHQATWWGTGLSAPSGATVFAGHVNWAGVTGPFAELWSDHQGDLISVEDNSGRVRQYQVSQVLTLSKDQLPQQAPTLFAPTGQPRIVVATCGGEWVGGQIGYADNRVLIALPVN